jgi:tetratricopeptide (TPR) repeat protein
VQQRATGNQNVQIADVVGSTIYVTFGGGRRRVPLEPARIGIGDHVDSAARLLKARSGVIPYTARAQLMSELEQWTRSPDPFGGWIVGGRGGSGKTHLGVELCNRMDATWLCGMLTQGADQGALEALVDAAMPRLVVVDYAESRVEQLVAMLPELAASGTEQHPVRVLLLVRARRGADWKAGLRYHSDSLDAVIDDMEVRPLEELPLAESERADVFEAAASMLSQRVGGGDHPPEPPDDLATEVFASPLMVVIRAYLEVRGGPSGDASRTTAGELFDELLTHERRYWRFSAQTRQLGIDDVLAQQVVALATLAGAVDERHAKDLLRLLPDLANASNERLGQIARWAHRLYAGPAWWNPLEPDRVGEHLVARTFADLGGEDAPIHTGDEADVLAGVLATDEPARLIHPLDLYARAIPDHVRLAEAVTTVLNSDVPRLCGAAAAQAASATRDELLLGDATVAATLERVLGLVTLDARAWAGAHDALPQRPDVIITPLGLTVIANAVEALRPLAREDPGRYLAILDAGLNNLSNRLVEMGRYEESLAAMQEAIPISRILAEDASDASEVNLARSLMNLAAGFDHMERHHEGLIAIQDAVTIYRRLIDNGAPVDDEYAMALNNLSNALAGEGRDDEALVAVQDAVEIDRKLAGVDPEAFAPHLGSSLNNLGIRLRKVGRREDALTAMQESVAVRQRLALMNPAAYEPDAATSLHNLSIHLDQAERLDESIQAIRDAIAIRRRLAEANRSAYGHDLAQSLHSLANRLHKAGRDDEGDQARREARTVEAELG